MNMILLVVLRWHPASPHMYPMTDQFREAGPPLTVLPRIETQSLVRPEDSQAATPPRDTLVVMQGSGLFGFRFACRLEARRQAVLGGGASCYLPVCPSEISDFGNIY